MIKPRENILFFIFSLLLTTILASALLAQQITKKDKVCANTLKTTSISYITLVNVKKEVTKKPAKTAKKVTKQKKIPKKIKSEVKQKVKLQPKIVKKNIHTKESITKKILKQEQMKEIEELESEKEELVNKEKEEARLAEEQAKLKKEEDLRKMMFRQAKHLKNQKKIYLTELSSWIKKHLKYPRKAKRMNQEGIVNVSFIITKEGKIESVSIDSACPYKRLNKAAKMLLIELAHFKPLPQNLDIWELKVPIVYALEE